MQNLTILLESILIELILRYNLTKHYEADVARTLELILYLPLEIKKEENLINGHLSIIYI